VYAPLTAGLALPYTAVRVGEEFTAAGSQVRAVCGRHAPIYGGRPDCVNLGYLVGGTLYHPGDSLHIPNEPVETLLVPLQASWPKTAEVIDFVRTVAPERACGIYDGQVNERGSARRRGTASGGRPRTYLGLSRDLAGQPFGVLSGTSGKETQHAEHGGVWREGMRA
jgi:hypothetical protein